MTIYHYGNKDLKQYGFTDPLNTDSVLLAVVKEKQTKVKTMSDEEKTMPEATFKAGQIQVTVWKNHIKSGDKEFDKLTLGIVKQYKDEDEKDESKQWKESKSFDSNDIPRLVSVLNKAYDFIVDVKTKLKE